ncbi:MAG: TPM domain-containing protein [Undibacterium sp.]|uniref:TPM domain-containing protein n=1 Tax=Undibacterium sp. TaxID=1914977 RepID=UPI00272399EA|nr:TPM domain-containing protein [Undibacterium sp.]MDO8651653.1 TPM domain-containing protein [Undibacterium sp.]
MLNRIITLFKHRWLDASDSRKAVSPEMAQRLMQRVTASEQRHSGEVRICVEAALPASYLWRHVWHKVPLHSVIRERAVMMFGKLHVWDTEHNNGVLIYLLLAEHAIELVADRGLNQRVLPQEWQAMIKRLGAALHESRFEDGLTQALEEVSALLVLHFPLPVGQADRNELPNAPVLG